MAEAANLRLVRCPKCENLLPELPEFSLYQCGGCGAVLKAKQKGILEDGSAELSDAVKGRGVSEEGSIVEALEGKMGSTDNTEDGVFDKNHEEVMVSNGGTTSRAESREARAESDMIARKGKERIRKLESSDNDYASYPVGSVRSRNQSNNFNVDGPEYVKFHGERVRDIRPPPMEPLRSRPVMDGVKTDGPGGPAQMGFGDFRYYDEGQSSYEKNSYYEPGEMAGRYRGHDPDGLSRMENLENGRADLIRRLGELKDQISRSCDISDKSKERLISNDRGVTASSTSPDPYGRRQAANYYPDDVSAPYFTDPRGCTPYTDRYNAHMPEPYPVRRHPHDLTHYSNNKSYRQEILRRPPSGPQSQYTQHHPYHEHFPGHYGPAPGTDINHHDLFMLHRHENFFHQPACSCAHCCDKSWHVPPKPVDPPGLHTGRFRNEPNFNPFGAQKLLPLNTNDLDYENPGLSYQRPRKFVTAHKSGRVMRPVTGGAPFIACTNCFETLKLPKKCILSGENGHKMKCGACSSIIMFEFGNTGIIASTSGHVDQVPTESDESSSGTLDENVRYWNDGSNSANMNAFSNDYDDFGNKKSNLDLLSSTSALSEDEQSPDVPVLTEVKSLPDPNLSCPDESSPDNITASRFDKRNKSQRPEQERISLDRANSQQKFVKDASVATEIDVSLNGFQNSCASQDPVEISRESDKPKVSKGGESFFAGLIKRSFIKDLRRSHQSVEVGGSQVFVNGHFIPDHVVKKAEKLSGPVQPGEYWYDKRSGFWGVMGHPCLGIIMPNIEEFNYSMPEKCAARNTGVYVNGRELHHKDLDLLSSRGLPITSQRSYLVEITGKVIDEQTGEELDGLGKLAPTVERSKHGFGMKIPRFMAQIQSQK